MIGLLLPSAVAALVGIACGGSLARCVTTRVAWWPVLLAAFALELGLYNPPINRLDWAISAGPGIAAVGLANNGGLIEVLTSDNGATWTTEQQVSQFDGITDAEAFFAYDSANIRPEDKANFLALIQEFRSQLNAYGSSVGRTYDLTAFLPADLAKINVGIASGVRGWSRLSCSSTRGQSSVPSI